jgi:tRNA1(Val) A37 N6-methylase TrmN6
MELNKNEVLINFLDIKDLKIIQRNDYFNFSLDTVLLSNFSTVNRTTKKILDIGTGNGAIPLLLSKKSTANITGVEIQDVSVDLAIRNILINKLEDRINIIHKDIKDIFEVLTKGSFDLVVSNPPFFKLDKNENQVNNLNSLSLARHEISINLEDVIRIASELLRNRGYFSIVHRTERLAEILFLFDKYSLGVKRIQFCYSKLNKESKTVLIEGIKNSDSTLKVLPPFFIHKENGEYTDRIKNIFKGNFE